jgi:hypothetical protein
MTLLKPAAPHGHPASLWHSILYLRRGLYGGHQVKRKDEMTLL